MIYKVNQALLKENECAGLFKHDFREIRYFTINKAHCFEETNCVALDSGGKSKETFFDTQEGVWSLDYFLPVADFQEDFDQL